MTPPNGVLAVMTDLFFLVQINDIAKRLGMKVESLRDKDAVLEKVRAKPAAVIFDLNCAGLEPLDTIRKIKGDPETKDVFLVAFVSHVQADLKRAAEESGCDVVLARSAFAQRLPEILRQLS